MFRINLYPTQGKRLWTFEAASPLVRKCSSVWCIGVSSYRVSEKRLPLSGHSNWALATTALENTVYFGSEGGRHYFGFGVGSVFGTGWKSDDPILSKTKAFHLKNTCKTLAEQNVDTMRAEMILAHGVIPDAENQPPHDPIEVGNDPCMFVYSTATRWRLSDLFMLNDAQRKTIFGVASEHYGWLQRFLHQLAQNWQLLQTVDKVKWKPSLPGIFIDGSFDISVDQAGISIEQVASTLAEMLKLPVPGSELRRWFGG